MIHSGRGGTILERKAVPSGAQRPTTGEILGGFLFSARLATYLTRLGVGRKKEQAGKSNHQQSDFPLLNLFIARLSREIGTGGLSVLSPCNPSVSHLPIICEPGSSIV